MKCAQNDLMSSDTLMYSKLPCHSHLFKFSEENLLPSKYSFRNIRKLLQLKYNIFS